MPKHAFAYYRTSSATNVEGDSQPRQRAAVEAYAKAQGIDIVAEFYDEAVKGADMIGDRPGFAAMLEAIAGNGVRLILVESASRFARDLIVQETGWKFLQGQGIALLAVDSPGAFLDDTPTAIMVRQILGAVSQFEKASLVAKLAAARRRLGKPGGKVPLSRLRPAVAARVHELRNEHPEASLREIAGLLAGEGFVTPSGKAYGHSAVGRLLS